MRNIKIPIRAGLVADLELIPSLGYDESYVVMLLVRAEASDFFDNRVQ